MEQELPMHIQDSGEDTDGSDPAAGGEDPRAHEVCEKEGIPDGIPFTGVKILPGNILSAGGGKRRQQGEKRPLFLLGNGIISWAVAYVQRGNFSGSRIPGSEKISYLPSGRERKESTELEPHTGRRGSGQRQKGGREAPEDPPHEFQEGRPLRDAYISGRAGLRDGTETYPRLPPEAESGVQEKGAGAQVRIHHGIPGEKDTPPPHHQRRDHEKRMRNDLGAGHDKPVRLPEVRRPAGRREGSREVPHQRSFAERERRKAEAPLGSVEESDAAEDHLPHAPREDMEREPGSAERHGDGERGELLDGRRIPGAARMLYGRR